MAAPVFGTAGTYLGGASSASAAVAVPASVAADDIILVHLYKENTAAITPPAGFTQVTNSPIATTTSVSQQSVWWKRATGGDTGTYTFSWTGSAWTEGVATRYTGCVTSGDPTEVNNFATSGSTAVLASPAVSGTTADVDRLLVWGATNFNGGGQITAPTGFTGRDGHTTGPTPGAIGCATKTQAAAGATGSVTSNWNISDVCTASLVALLPDTGGGPGVDSTNATVQAAGPWPGF